MGEERMTRLVLEDTPFNVLQKMSEGNPGALKVCVDIMEKGNQIDHDSASRCLGALLILDTCQIYGARIWMLYKDVCGEELVKIIAIIRAYQLGLLDLGKLNHAIDNNGDGIDVDEIEQQVKARLSAFGKEEEKGD
jgi:hypothetical protein